MITFANSYIRPGEGDISPTITIDAYSSAKTVRGAISDFGRYILKHLGLAEGEWFIKDKKDMLFPMSESGIGYFLEVQEVAYATRLNEKDEIEYKEGYNYYLVSRIVLDD